MAEGDEKFEELYAYHGAIVSFVMSLGFSRDEARDLAQDVFVRVYEHMDTYRGTSKWAFLQQVARRLALNAIRAKHAAKRTGDEVPPEDVVDLASQTSRPDETYDRNAEAKRLHAAIDKLDRDSRTIVLLQLAEFSYGEMAQILGISVPAVKSRLYVARGHLRELLGEEPDGLGGE